MDIPWPATYIDACTRAVVDMQYAQIADAAGAAESAHFYLEGPSRDYVGNGILFRMESGSGYTTNLSKAKALDKEELFEDGVQLIPGIAWPKAYLDAKSRQAADCRLADIKVALGSKFEKLEKAEKVRKTQYRCHGCGKFLSIGDCYSTSGCNKCGTDNRP